MKKSKIILLIAIFVSGGFLLSTLGNLNRKEPESPSTKAATTANPSTIQYGLPVRIKIPKLSIDAPIDQMGVTPEGDMQEPSKLQNAGWYKFGPRPGNRGSAVIAGHYGLNDNHTAVFNKLHTLSQGDVVQVIDEKGVVAAFAVRELKTYGKDAIVPEVFSSRDEKAHLNLITCKGTWQKDKQTYSDRLVIFADSK